MGIEGIMFSIVPTVVTLGFFLVFALIIVFAVKGISQWNRNNHSPVLTVKAWVTSKRISVSHHHNSAVEPGMFSSSTTYYVTFQVESGDRMEFRVSGNEYGMMAEQDFGILTFQGTRFQSFVREQ